MLLAGVFPGELFSQSLSAVNPGRTETTAYPSFPTNDPIYYFCTQEGVSAGSLSARSAGSSVTFLWEKYNPASLKFENFTNETGTSSTLSRLADGCYRVSFTENGTAYAYRAWIMNGWVGATASVALSTCTLLRLAGTATGASYQY